MSASTSTLTPRRQKYKCSIGTIILEVIAYKFDGGGVTGPKNKDSWLVRTKRGTTRWIRGSTARTYLSDARSMDMEPPIFRIVPPWCPLATLMWAQEKRIRSDDSDDDDDDDDIHRAARILIDYKLNDVCV